jgi:hypothetical protein
MRDPARMREKYLYSNSVTLGCKFDNPRNELIDCLGFRSGSRSNSGKSERCRDAIPHA